MHSTKTEVLPNVAIYLGSTCVQYECMHFPHISAQISSAQDGSSFFGDPPDRKGLTKLSFAPILIRNRII